MALFGSSSPFGTSTPSPFGSTSPSPNPFGSATPSSPFGANQSTSMFGAKPFGSPTFGAQTGASLFGGTATGVFGATQASPLGSTTPAFGASSAPAFGSTPSFGQGASIFGQKPATPFGGFGSTSTQANPFGSTPFGQTQPAFGSPSFGSTVPAFGSSTPAFGSTPFGSTTPAFGASSTPAFGASTTPSFGASGTPAFGASSTPAFGASSAPAFGTASTSLFGSTTPAAFGSTTTPAFGSTSVFGSGSGASPFGASTTPAFGTSPSFGTSTFASSSFGSQQRPGSRATPYVATNDAEAGVSGQIGKLMSISAMPTYKNKSPEELRWEDYQAGDKGGPSSVQQPAAGIFGQTSTASPFGTTSSAFSPTPTANPFGANTSSIFGSKPSGTFGMPTTGSSFSSSGAPFGSLSSSPAFGAPSSPAFGIGMSSPFGTGSTSAFNSNFNSASSSFGTSTPSFTSTPAFSSPAPSIFSSGTSVFGANPFQAQQTQTSSPLFPGSNQPFGTSPSAFSTPNIGSNMFGSSSSLFPASKPPTLSQPGGSLFGGIQSNPPQQSTMGSFGFPSLGQSQPANAFGATPVMAAGATSFAQQPSVPVPVTNPFGTLPTLPQMSIGRSAGAGPSVQYGISSLPVSERPTQLRSTSLLTPRHITQRSRVRMQARRYHPNKDSPKVSFFSDGEETTSSPKADALFVPRENPRALFIRPQQDNSPSSPASAGLKIRDIATPVKQGNGTPDESSPQPQETESPPQNGSTAAAGMASTSHEAPTSTSKPNGLHVEHTHRGNGYISITGHRAGEAAVAYEHGADIEALMPKLRHSDYYVQPRVQELAAKERAEPGYCRRVKGFVVGRHGYGLVKFLGETDVRGLDLESIIQFNKCEVLVYMDESKKPPPGVGLNKPAEITLLNVRCVEKKSGQHLSEGPEVEKFEKKLKKKTEEQGAEFLAYNAVKGEWTFRVLHFSKYGLEGRKMDDGVAEVTKW